MTIMFLNNPFLEGLRRALPIALGYMPVGFAFGVLAVKNGITPALAIAMAVLMFSGSGQFVFASMWGHGAGIISVVAAVLIINLRYMLMSLAESAWTSRLPFIKRFLLGFGITDETFVVHATSLMEGWKLNFITMLTCNSTTHLSWIIGCAIGAFSGELISDTRSLGLDYAITAMFLALLIPQCVSRLHTLVAIFTVCFSIALKMAGWSQGNIALATIVGATLGLVLSSRKGLVSHSKKIMPLNNDDKI